MTSDAAEAVLFTTEGGLYIPSEHTRGPWDPSLLHGGAPAALLTRCFEKHVEGADLTFGRLGFEFLRPIPMAPLEVTITVARPGRRVSELHAELASEGVQIGRADALLVRPVGEDVPVPDQGLERMPPKEEALVAAPETASEAGPAEGLLAGSTGFGSTGMEVRWLDQPWSPGPARVWARPRMDLLPGEPMSPLARAVAAADFGNGVGVGAPVRPLPVHQRRPDAAPAAGAPGRLDRPRRPHAAIGRRAGAGGERAARRGRADRKSVPDARRATSLTASDKALVAGAVEMDGIA